MLQTPCIPRGGFDCDKDEEVRSVNEYNMDLEGPSVDKPSLAYDIHGFCTGGKESAAKLKYLGERRHLLGDIVRLDGRKGEGSAGWKVIGDVLPIELPATKPSPDVSGICGFDFSNTTENTKTLNKPSINNAHLLLHMWPGDIKKQLEQLNHKIADDNNDQRKR